MGKKSESAADVVTHIQSGHRIFVHGGAATPNALLKALVQQADRLQQVELLHLHTEGPALYADPQYEGIFNVANFFVGPNLRKHFNKNRIDYLPCFLSDMPKLLKARTRPLDVVLLHLSPPDKHGYCTLGTSVDAARAAFEVAPLRLAQINTKMPRTHGDTYIHIDEIDHFVEVNEDLVDAPCHPPTAIESAIAKNVASLIEDGACLQLGIGAIPNAVLAALNHHKHLGIHSEMWSDGALALIKCGAVDNSQKKDHAGKTVSTFIMGSQELYDFVDDNPSVIQLGADYVNNPFIIAQNPNVVAVNSAIEIDLTGQVCADSLGPRIVSGVGGQMDFMRGAAGSKGGKSVIAIPSRTKDGQPRIVGALRLGAGVVTTRADVHFVATEYGIADLYGKTLHERAKALTALAHPEDRESLAEYLASRS